MAARRVSMPAADDLFRPTAPEGDVAGTAPAPDAQPGAAPTAAAPAGPPERRPSGRVKHDEKMTVYVTSEELLAIEDARLRLRAQHGLAVDRGRLVRAAVALALADLDEHGADAALVRRLGEA